jgi:twinkle protein
MELQNWLESRNLDGEIVTGMGVEQFQKNGQTWVKIPYRHSGEIVNHKFRNLEEKGFYQEPNGKKCFYNHDVISDQTIKDLPLIITEGEPDAWAAIQAGFVKTVSVPDGAPASSVEGDSAKYDYLMEIIELIRANAPHVILAVDSDGPGKNLLHDLSLRIGRDFCKFVSYPVGCKDLNDALMKYGVAGVVQSINRAQWVRLDGVYKASELPPVAAAEIFDTGFTGIEENYKVRLGDFTVITGVPSHGKSTFVNDLCCRLSLRHGLRTVFASFEQHPSLDHLRNLRKWHAGTQDFKDQSKTEEWLENHFSFVYPTESQQFEETINLSWLLEKMAASVIRHRSQICVIDPWNELDHDFGGDSETVYISKSIKRFRKFARMMNVHVVLVAHPTKLVKGKDGKIPMPSLYDISGSANFANKADIGIVIHKEDGVTKIAIQKSRYHDMIGKPGEAKFKFNSHLNKFEWQDF